MVYLLNPNWRRAVKPKSDVAKIAAEYVDWNGGKILPFQVRFFNEAYAQKRDGSWKYGRVAMNTPRQNSKTKCITALVIYAMYVNGSEILVSSHEMASAHKIFEDVFETINNNAELKAERGRYSTGAGKEYIQLTGGGRVVFRSRKNSGAGMGGTYDVVVLDEAQELKADYESMVTKTLKTKKNALVVYTGTPFLPTSIGDVFNTILDTAEEEDDMFAIRYGIDDENADITDETLWALTNPLYPDVIPDKSFKNDIAIARQNGAQGELDFRIQDLGLWWKDKIPPAISPALWDSSYMDIDNDPNTNVCAVVFDPACGRVALSVASCSAAMTKGTESYERWKYISGEIIAEKSPNESWKWISDIVETMPRNTPLILDAGGLNRTLEQILPGNVQPIHLTGPEFLASQQGFVDLLESGRFKHTNQPELMQEARNVQKVQSGDQWKFSPIRKTTTIAGFKALTEAAWYRSINEPKEIVQKVVYV